MKRLKMWYELEVISHWGNISFHTIFPFALQNTNLLSSKVVLAIINKNSPLK